MTTLIAASVFVVIAVSLSLGAIGIVLLTTHDIRRTVKRGTGETNAAMLAAGRAGAVMLAWACDSRIATRS